MTSTTGIKVHTFISKKLSKKYNFSLSFFHEHHLDVLVASNKRRRHQINDLPPWGCAFMKRWTWCTQRFPLPGSILSFSPSSSLQASSWLHSYVPAQETVSLIAQPTGMFYKPRANCLIDWVRESSPITERQTFPLLPEWLQQFQGNL